VVTKIAGGLTVVVVLLGPAAVLLGMATLMNPAAQASCLPNTTIVVAGEVPDSLTATTAGGQPITLNRTPLTHAATIITIGGQTPGVGQDGILVALMAALTESTLRMLANTSAYPESADYPHDGDGSDHDSLGLFQMRRQSGWGTVAELMDPTYQARAFYGGPAGPNHGSPPGLLDIPNWQNLTLGEAAQAVEVSAYPDRYANYEPVARTIYARLTAGGHPGSAPDAPPPADSGRVVEPLPTGSYTITDTYGERVHPITGRRTMHWGTDMAAPAGTPILAIADGVVTHARPAPTYGNVIIIDHLINAQPVASMYGHMPDDGVHVRPGDLVAAGQQIGAVGSAGVSTGPHLHIEIHPGGSNQPQSVAVDAQSWLADHGAEGLHQPARRLRRAQL
jgi:murein DD-endopeptidase MepM/ murein hydrolase activator NlpD